MSDYLERLIGRAKNGDLWDALPASTAPPTPTEKHSVQRDSFDKSAWSQITDQVPALGEQVTEAAAAHPTAAAGYEDLFNLLNQGDPRFTELGAMAAEYVPQHAMFEAMFEADDFKWVRNETRYDEYNTALAMLAMDAQMDDAFDQIEEATEAIAAAQEALAEALAAAAEYMEAGGVIEGPVGEGGTSVPMTPELAELIERLENAMAGQATAEEEGNAAGAEASAMLAAGVTQAKEAIEQEKSQASAYGYDDGVLKRMDYAERRRLAQRLDHNRLTRFADLLGSTRMLADAERRRKVNHAPAEIYDVELGNNLHKMIASEFNNLAIPELEDLLWLRFAQHTLPQWKTRGPENQGKGPIIVVCDESSSMTMELSGGNTREAWSKAVSLALVDQAKRSKRDFIYIGFSSTNQVWETRFTDGNYAPEQIINFAEHFFNGGTSYEKPLTRAMEIIGTYESAGKDKPDVVFITDAECDVAPAFTERWQVVKQRADVRCFGIQIGGSGRYTAMSQLVDRCIQINQLNGTPEAVTELFRTI